MNEFGSRRGMTDTRVLRSMILGKTLSGALAFASGQDWRDTPEVVSKIRAAIDAISTGDAGSFIGQPGADILALVRPREIISRIPGIIHVPFDVRLLVESVASTAVWVGEENPATLTRPAYAAPLPLERLKVVSLSAVTEELARSSSPSAESLLSRSFANGITLASDTAFIDVTNAGAVDTKPPSITFGAPAFVSSGATAAVIDADLGKLIDSVVASGSTLEYAAWIMSTVTLAFLARLRDAGGALAYPNLSMKTGGELSGLPVIASASVPRAGEPLLTTISLVDGAGIWVSDDGEFDFMASRSASLQMVDGPESRAAVAVSMFQTNSVAIRGTRFINWKRAVPDSVSVLTGVAY